MLAAEDLPAVQRRFAMKRLEKIRRAEARTTR